MIGSFNDLLFLFGVRLLKDFVFLILAIDYGEMLDSYNFLLRYRFLLPPEEILRLLRYGINDKLS